MKKLIIIVIAITFLNCDRIICQNYVPRQSNNESTQEYSCNKLIIYYNSKKSKARLLKAIKSYKAEIIYIYHNFNCIAISIPDDKKLEDAILYFQKVKGIVAVDKDYIEQLD